MPIAKDEGDMKRTPRERDVFVSEWLWRRYRGLEDRWVVVGGRVEGGKETNHKKRNANDEGKPRTRSMGTVPTTQSYLRLDVVRWRHNDMLITYFFGLRVGPPHGIGWKFWFYERGPWTHDGQASQIDTSYAMHRKNSSFSQKRNIPMSPTCWRVCYESLVRIRFDNSLR